MPKKKQALPTPKAKLYTEDAALLVPIFQKEPFITFQELQVKYGDILTDQQIYRGLLGTFSPYPPSDTLMFASILPGATRAV